MPQSAMTDSRFYMWRAVIALAHVHELLTAEKPAFIEDHIKNLPLAELQQELLGDDLQIAQSIDEMLLYVTEQKDHEDFLQFAQMLTHGDSNRATRELVIVGLLISEQRNTINNGEAARQLHQSHIASQLRNSVEDEEFKRQAANTGVRAKWRSGFKYWKNALIVVLGTAKLVNSERVNTATNWMWQQAFNELSKDNITPLFNGLMMPEKQRRTATKTGQALAPRRKPSSAP